MIPFVAPVATWAAKSALMQSPIGGFLKMVPPRVWKALLLVALVALVIFLAWRWFDGKLDDAYDRGDKAGYSRAIEEGEKRAKKTDLKTSQATTRIRKQADAKATAINAAADRERLLGPGAAASRCPTLPGPASGHQPPAGRPDDAAHSVPAGNRFPDASEVPWGWLVSHAQQCDLNRNEVEAWRKWHAEMLALWPKR